MAYLFNQKFIFRALGLLALFLAVVIGFSYGFSRKSLFSANASLIAANMQSPSNSERKRVKRVRLWAQFQNTLQALGDRLETEGKERLILTGTIKRNSAKAGEIPARMIVELPDKLRLEEQIGNKLRVTTFDGEKQGGLKRSDDNGQGEQDDDELESLIFDGPEHLFSGQMAGLAKREIGAFLQPNGGASSSYVGPFYNVYEISDLITHGATSRVQRKLYYFNAKTALPEIVQYQIERGRGSLKVELRLADWQSFSGQMIPKTFARFENGAEVLKLNVSNATIQAAVNDGIFTIPGK